VIQNNNQTQESGSSLVVALVILLVLTVLGIFAMQVTALEERMAGNLRDRELAFQAAEAALREGEAFLRTANLPPFNETNGLYQPLDPATNFVPLWATINWSDPNASRAYGGQLSRVSAQPRYIIEELPAIADQPAKIRFYRITARGVGGTTTAVVFLQTTFRRDSTQLQDLLASSRQSWRQF
jgi:type IV pilus assembly protein PilX